MHPKPYSKFLKAPILQSMQEPFNPKELLEEIPK